jgi:PTH1 family peptidyl-tRNA hydrolase
MHISPYLVIGLGNPGDDYEKTRHNIGFLIVDAMAQTFPLSFNTKLDMLFKRVVWQEKELIFLKPQNYMNRSGSVLSRWLHFFKMDASRMIVCHDDLDLNFGDIRLKDGGGHAGHNGIRDIIANIGKDFKRLRFGIGRPDDKAHVSDYVLSNFSKNEQQEITSQLLDKATQMVFDYIHSK